MLIDGYVATAAAAVLHAHRRHRRSIIALPPIARPSRPIARCSAKIGKKPLLDLGMRLGEATGAALAAALVKAAANLHTGMATFESAGVSEQGLAASTVKWMKLPSASDSIRIRQIWE